MPRLSTSKITFFTWDRMSDFSSRLLAATPIGDDPVALLVNAGRTYVPIDHSSPDASQEVSKIGHGASISVIIEEIMRSTWYKDQIAYRRLIGAKDAQTGTITFLYNKFLFSTLHRCIKPPCFFYHHRGSFSIPQHSSSVFSPGGCNTSNETRETCHCVHEYSIWKKYNIPGQLMPFP